MKLFVAFIFCTLAPFVFAAKPYGQAVRCKCVDKEFCSVKFNPLIEPRGIKCDYGQICCKPENILPSINDNNYDSDYQTGVNPANNYENQAEKASYHGKCGQRTKISAYKRLVLPAAYAKLGEFPWQAALLRNYTDGFVFVSSGVLIDRDIILTTAHNVENLQANNILVRLGENNVQADPSRKYSHINSRVSKIIVKEDFNRDTLENDFAVLCLEKRVKCNEVVSPICLPEPTDVLDTNYCTVSGWGKSSYNGNYSTILRKATLSLVDQNKCQYLIRKRIYDPTFVLDNSFVCAGGQKGKDACTGDAGGPLSCPNKNGQQVLAGIVSWGIGCGEKDVPGVYANVRDPASLIWIKNAIRECRKRDYAVPANLPSNYNYEQINRPLDSYANVRPVDSYNVRPVDRPLNNYNNRPVDNYNDRPVDKYNDRPLDNYNNRPVDKYNDRPLDNYNNRPVENNRPLDNYNNRPVDNYNNRPVENYNNRPVENYNDRPVDKYNDLPEYKK